MQQIADWLEKLGMSGYAGRFAENRRIDFSVLRDLTDQDLKDIGVVLGDRRKILRAISELAGAAPATSQVHAVTEPRPQHSAERRQVTVMFSDLVGSTAPSARSRASFCAAIEQHRVLSSRTVGRSISRANKNEVGTQRRNRSSTNDNAHRSRRAVSGQPTAALANAPAPN